MPGAEGVEELTSFGSPAEYRARTLHGGSSRRDESIQRQHVFRVTTMLLDELLPGHYHRFGTWEGTCRYPLKKGRKLETGTVVPAVPVSGYARVDAPCILASRFRSTGGGMPTRRPTDRSDDRS